MTILFEDIVDTFSDEETNSKASKEIMPLEDFTDATEPYTYCMALVLHMNFSERFNKAKRGNESFYKFPMNLQTLVEKMATIVE